jgi:Xaa-Pro dipeptidase
MSVDVGRINAIPKEEFAQRARKIQSAMNEQNIDVLIAHACECESANARYLSDFWCVFDFVGIVIPKIGEPIFLTGGPESLEFAKKFSQIDDVRVHPFYVETSAPVWDKPSDHYDYKKIFDEFRKNFDIKKIGIANENIIPHKIVKDIERAAPDAVFVCVDEIVMRARWYKSENEIALLKKAYEITEKAIMKTIDSIRPGISENELEAIWRGEIYKLGAEGTSYPVWVTSGDSTFQSLCSSTERKIEQNDMVQFSLGAKYKGYCGNIGRAVVLGKIPQRHMDMLQVALEADQETLESIKPGVPFKDVYNKFKKRLEKNGFENLNLYGPAHGTGLQECEGPWVDNRTDMVFEPGMVFNVDIWIADDKYGIRLEDGIVVTKTGTEILNSYHSEIIRL